MLYLHSEGIFYIRSWWLPESNCCLLNAKKDYCKGLLCEQSKNISRLGEYDFDVFHLLFIALKTSIFLNCLTKNNRFLLNAFLESLNNVASTAEKHMKSAFVAAHYTQALWQLLKFSWNQSCGACGEEHHYVGSFFFPCWQTGSNCTACGINPTDSQSTVNLANFTDKQTFKKDMKTSL